MTDLILDHLSSLPPTPTTRLLCRRYILNKEKKKRRLTPISLSTHTNISTRRIPLINHYSCPTGLIQISQRTPNLILGTRAKYDVIKYISETRYENSLASRIYGNVPRLVRISAWTGKRLHPYIWRNEKIVHTPRMKLMAQIIGHRMALLMRWKDRSQLARREFDDRNLPENNTDFAAIDYVYFERGHLKQVNDLLRENFWQGIDVHENLAWPAMYKKQVIGCAFMSPECYLTYFSVRQGWQRAGIGRFMLFHLDITLHVTVDNPAMLLYQNFGFKTEKYM